MELQGRRRRGRVDGWTELGMISKRRDCQWRNCITELHGGVHHHTSTPHDSGIQMKGGKKRKSGVSGL